MQVSEGIEHVHGPFSMNPAQRALADVELASIITDDHDVPHRISIEGRRSSQRMKWILRDSRPEPAEPCLASVFLATGSGVHHSGQIYFVPPGALKHPTLSGNTVLGSHRMTLGA